MLGLPRGEVLLVDHETSWEDNARQTILALQSIFGDTAIDIQHVGSTSIASIKAKPIIDIAVAVRRLDDVLPQIPSLEAQGFHHRPENDNAEQLFFSCGNDIANTRTHHIHVVVYGSREWKDYLAFRECLKQDPYAARQYEEVKLRLKAQYPYDRVAYTEGKAACITRLLRKAHAQSALGQCITVTVDRPLGTRHPAYPAMTYSVNYGYVRGILGGDGEDQDVYVLGVKEPVREFTGTVIAVILRENDGEDKWVVAPPDCRYNQAEILAEVAFQEQYFESSILCLYEKSCGVIVYRQKETAAYTNPSVEYLLLFQYKSRTWSFPKGHVEPFETEQQTARREVYEETGLHVDILDGFRECVQYPVNRKGTKYVFLYLGQALGEVTVKADEIEQAVWVDKAEALRLLPPVGYDTVLEQAEKRLGARITDDH